MLSCAGTDHGRGKGAGEGGGSSETLDGRRETFSYLLTLMRGAGPVSSGIVPAIDISGMEHLAWTLDALHYLLEVCTLQLTLISLSSHYVIDYATIM